MWANIESYKLHNTILQDKPTCKIDLVLVLGDNPFMEKPTGNMIVLVVP